MADVQLSSQMYFLERKLLKWRGLSLMTSADLSQDYTKIHSVLVFIMKDRNSASDLEKLQILNQKLYKKQHFKMNQNDS